MHEPGTPGRGLALLAGLLTVAAVAGAALVYLPLDVDDEPGAARFESTGDGEAAPLCGSTTDGTHQKAIDAGGDDLGLRLQVICASGDLDEAALLVNHAGEDPRVLYTIENTNEVLAATAPDDKNVQLAVGPDDLDDVSGSAASDPALVGGDVTFQLVDGDPTLEGTATVLQVVETDDGDVIVHLPATASVDESGASVTALNPAGEAISVDTRDHVDLQDLLGGDDLPVDEGTVTDAAGDVLALVEVPGVPGDDPAKATYGTVRKKYDQGTTAVFSLSPSGVTLKDADGNTLVEVTLPGEETGPSLPGADVLDPGSTCTEVAGSLEMVHEGDCSGDVDEIRVPSAPGTGDVTSAATIERADDGGWTLKVGGQSHPLPGQTVHVPSTPADPGVAQVVQLLDGDGDDVTDIEVKKDGAGLVENATNVDVVRKVEDASGDVEENVTTLVSDYLVVEYNLTGAAVNATVFPGDEPGPGDLVIRKSADRWVVETPFGSATATGADLTVAPSAADPQKVHLILRDDEGDTVARFDVAADADDPGQAEASYNLPPADESGSLSPPVAILGSTTDPEGLRVTGPDGGTLLLYEEAEGDAATVSVPPAGVTEDVRKETLRLEGNPLVDDEATLVIEDQDGETVHEFTINRPNYREAARQTAREADDEAPADLSPVVSAVDTATGSAPETRDEPDYLTEVADGNEAWGEESRLAGQRWMSGLRNLTFEATFDETAAYDRFYVRYASGTPVSMDAPTVALEPVDGNQSHRRGTLDLPNPGAWDGETMWFEVVAERRPADLVAYGRVDNRTDAPFGVRVDGARPTAEVNAPSDPDGTTWLVDWGGEDAGSGVVEFTVEKQIAGGGWQTLAERTTGRSQQVTGQADLTYQFRVRASDAVNHTSPWTDPPAEVTYQSPTSDPDPDGSPADDGDDANQAPTVDILSPSSDEDVSGIVEIRWSSDDPDGTAPAESAYIRPEGDEKWSPLRTNSDRAYWDTSEWANGDYEIKVVADDGTLTGRDSVTGVSVANELDDAEGTDPQSPGSGADGGGGSDDGADDGGTDDGSPAGGDSSEAQDDGSGGEGGGIPGPSAAVVALAAAGAATLARRRGRS